MAQSAYRLGMRARPPRRMGSLILLGLAHQNLGDWGTAEALLEEARAVGLHWDQLGEFPFTRLCDLRLWQGRWEEAAELAQAALERREYGRFSVFAGLRWNETKALLLGGAREQAERDVEQLEASWPRPSTTWRCSTRWAARARTPPTTGSACEGPSNTPGGRSSSPARPASRRSSRGPGSPWPAPTSTWASGRPPRRRWARPSNASPARRTPGARPRAGCSRRGCTCSRASRTRASRPPARRTRSPPARAATSRNSARRWRWASPCSPPGTTPRASRWPSRPTAWACGPVPPAAWAA